MERVGIKIRNYNQTEKTNKIIENKLEILLKQIPCNSCVFLEVDYNQNVFYGKLKVLCFGQTFFAKDESDSIGFLVHFISKKIQKQVMKWKKKRTRAEITEVIDIESLRNKKSKHLSYKYKQIG